MLLVVDVGNSHTVLGLYDGRELRGHWRVVTANYRTGDELQILLMMLLQSIELHPRQITGCSGFAKNPIEIAFTPCATSGRNFSSAFPSGRFSGEMPSMIGIFGP